MNCMTVETDAWSFFSEFYPRLYRFIAAETSSSHADVEDLVQETLLHAWSGREQFRGESLTLTWMLAIARHRIYEQRRRQRSVRRAPSAELPRDLAAGLIPDALLGDEDIQRRVRETLRDLPQDYSDHLIRRYFEGRSVRAIADEQHEGEDAVESRLRRARQAFRARFERGGSAHE
jgi:RNA polymerase sigma-70 factor (ECF subfamily)